VACRTAISYELEYQEEHVLFEFDSDYSSSYFVSIDSSHHDKTPMPTFQSANCQQQVFVLYLSKYYIQLSLSVTPTVSS